MRKRALRLVALGISAIMAGSLFVGGVAADPGGLPTIQGIGMVEINVPSRDAIDALNDGGWDLSEYRRDEDNGTFTIRVLVDQDELAELAAMGFGIGIVIEDERDWLAARADADAALAASQAALSLAVSEDPTGGIAAFGILPQNEVIIQRANFFENYAGSFLYVEARTTLGTSSGGPTLALAWDRGPATAMGSGGTDSSMTKYNDPDVASSVAYQYHREIYRVGPLGTPPYVPDMVRVTSSAGGIATAPVTLWLNPQPPLTTGYMKDFTNRYENTYEIYAELEALAAEFPDIAEIIELPNKTTGYQRVAMATMQGTTGIGSAPSTANQASAVVLWSQMMGHLGGEQIRAQFRNPGVANSPLTVTVVPGNPLGGSDIIVDLATSGTGALTSTAVQVRNAINASPAAFALVRATLYATNAGAGVVPARALVAMDDFLNAPASVPRGPITQKAIRIGKVRDGSKVGVFPFCNQHAREWTTPMVCLETAYRMLKNYATDPTTRDLVDNLDIFILPTLNPDGNIVSRYDFQSQRKNMPNYCSPTSTDSMPSGRNGWGVDLNRNDLAYNGFQGYGGASTSCTNEVYRGPSAGSELEMKNMHWLLDNNTNIKFSNNIHSSGGYFMWSPGAYITAGRITAPAPNIGIESYFFAAGDTILARIKEDRQTVILPQRTGPVADVLYSAAGNSADEQYYNRGMIAYSFETGADRFSSTTTGVSQSGVGGFFPTYATEGKGQILEFASGNFGMFEEALKYARDTTPPQVDLMVCDSLSPALDCHPVTTNQAKQSGTFLTTFRFGNEPSVIRYTTDGSEPTMASPTWEAQGPRRPGQNFSWDTTTTLKFFGTDIKGNVSAVQTVKLSIDPNAPTIDIVEPQEAVTQVQGQPGNYGLNSAQNASYTCSDDDSGVVSCVGTVADGALFDTSTVGFHTFTVDAVDLAGNAASKTVTYNVIYDLWSGFLAPVEEGVLNVAKAGSTIPLKFKLGANYGLGVLVGGYPQSVKVACDSSLPTDAVEETSSPGATTFAFNGSHYQYNWKTEKSWAGTCRQLIMRLSDNTVHTILLKLT